MNVIETARLIIRPLLQNDLMALHSLYSYSELMKYITGHPRTLAETRVRLKKNLREHEEYDFSLCAVLLKEDNRFIGRCGLEPAIIEGELQGDIAWMFLQEYWGQGLATEFGKSIIPYGFEQLGLKRIFAIAKKANTASIRVMQKLGMRFVNSEAARVEYEIKSDNFVHPGWFKDYSLG